MSSWSLVSFTTLIWIVCAQLCDSDYLFMSCNEKPNIVAWNVNTSKLLTKKLLDTTSIDWISSKDLRFRGMAIMDDILFVANSKEDVSFIGKWSCQPDTKDGGSSNFDKLAFIGNFTGLTGYNHGLQHPYGIRWHTKTRSLSAHSKDPFPDLFVTAQDSQSLLKYKWNGFPEVMTPNNNQYPGSIVTFGSYSDSSNGVRDVEVDSVNGLIFVAEEVLKMVLVYSIDDGFTNLYNITYESKAEPIGLSIDTSNRILFVGDNSYDAVYAVGYDLSGFKVLWKTDKTKELDHPAGIAVNEQFVFVVSQRKDRILRFDKETGKYVDKFVDYKKMKVKGENLLYVPGNGCSN